jgi:hypothetical protein
VSVFRLLTAMLVLPGLVMAWIAGRPRPPLPRPLLLDRAGVEGDPTVRDDQGRIVVANLRTVEAARLYRCSSFPVNAQMQTPQGAVPYPAAFLGPHLFEALRARNVRQVISLDEAESAFYAEQGYFKYWADQTGYAITVTWLPVAADEMYGRSDRSGLHAGAVLVSTLREGGVPAGAVLVHGESGKDATGVAAAVYETWRNQGWVERDTLWRDVTERYLASNRLLREVGPFAGRPSRCASGQEGFVCPEWLEALREDVEYIAKL